MLFDCDGVLVDSDEAAAEAWNAWAREYAPGFDFERDIVHGRPARDTIAELVPSVDRSRAVHALMLREVETAAMVRALPGALELLTSLPATGWTVVTSGVLLVAQARLRAAGLPCPHALVTADDVRHGKPAPDPYRLGARRLGVPAARTVVFEDADAGVRSARSAGVGLAVGVGDRGLHTSAHVVVADLSGIRFDGTQLDLRGARQLRAPSALLEHTETGEDRHDRIA
nr:HAD-IA family hydrolase [Cryobacterium roopkundense]